MEAFNVAGLIGKKVIVKLAGAGEARGVVEAVLASHVSEDKETAINITTFLVQFDSGASAEVPGSEITRVEP